MKKLSLLTLLLTLCFLCGCTETLLHNSPFTVFQKSIGDDKTPHQAEVATANAEIENQSGTADAGAEDGTTTGVADKNRSALDTADTEQSPRQQAALDEALDFCKAAQTLWEQGKFDDAILALDQAYALLLEADAGSDSDLLQQKEDLRFLISKRTLEIYASRHTIVNGTHKAIPIVINKDVQNEIKWYTTGKGRNFFIESYQRSGKYRPMIKKELEKAGLPDELSWLPLIESGFKIKALSKARALGLWQFIPSTGYKFGLERNMYIDERLDPVKATDAAIAYLKALHQIFGDWATVLAAYNCGEGRVLRIIRTKNINYLDNFWDLYQQLPRETARYVPKFLATLHIVNNLEKYGMADIAAARAVACDTVEISRRVHLKSIAQAIDTPYADLQALNPELRQYVLPGEAYQLNIPKDKKALLLARIDSLPISSPPQPQFVYHRIRRGESLSTIARKYRTTMSNIARANNIYHYNRIRAGKLLKIPLSRNWTATSTSHPRATQSGPANHVVCRGESLWLIARQYGTTVATLRQTNNLSADNIDVGQVIKIPGRGNNAKTYQVKKGDSPFTIALRHNMSLQQFLSLNNLTPRNKIFPGQTVYVAKNNIKRTKRQTP